MPNHLAARPEIPSLTGMRFIAASLVVVAHTSSYFVAAQPSWLDFAWRVGANLGMTIFFVLSGFVIHYNYGAAIASKGAPAIASFLVARFARLYPLYLLALLVCIVLTPSIISEDTFRWVWLWRYLTMTQDWTPTLIGGKLLTTLYFGSAWSISAEAALYIFYLAAAVSLDGLRVPRTTLYALVTLSVVGFIFVAGYATGFLLSSVQRPDWWLALSPLSRLPEFFLGALTAQLYVVSPEPQKRPVAHARWIGLCGLTWLVGVFLACFWYPNFQAAFGFAPGIAMVIFWLARYRSRAASLVEAPLMVALGDASYSIYMLHGFALGYIMRQTPYAPGILRIALAWGVITVISVATYHYFEAPARRLIRRFATRKPSALGPHRWSETGH
jgi:peptidoglycan/LPS O-acetylase OafA/YrhL